MRKAQSAMEYLLVVALTFAIIVPTTYLFFSYTKESSSRVVDYRINSVGKSILRSATSVYYSGEHSKTVVDVDIPPNINGAFILSNRELIFNTTFENQDSEVVFFFSFNITSGNCTSGRCDFPETFYSSGIKHIKTESIDDGNQVLIGQVSD